MLHVKRKCRQNAILVFICGLYVVYLCSCIKRPESYPQIPTVSPPEITKLQQEGTTKASLKFPVPQKKFSKRGAPLTDFTTSIFLGSHSSV